VVPTHVRVAPKHPDSPNAIGRASSSRLRLSKASSPATLEVSPHPLTYPVSRDLQRCDRGNLVPESSTLETQLVVRLQVHPKLFRGPEVPR